MTWTAQLMGATTMVEGNDREVTLRTAVTIYVLRVSQDVDFDIEFGGIVVGATVSALGRDIDS